MKKGFTVIIFVVCILLSGCTMQTTAAMATGKAGTSAQEPDPLDFGSFSVTVADGWKTLDVLGGVQIYKQSGELLQIQIDGENSTDKDALTLLQGLQKNYGGSKITEERLLGCDFKNVTFKIFGKDQCMYIAVVGGRQIKIQATGKTIEDDPDIKEMVDSIVLNETISE